MRMRDLSRAAGLPVATVKYYQRAGLLAPGERIAPNQAQYGADHLRQLKLVRSLLRLGGLSIAEVREVLGDRPNGHQGRANSTLSTPVDDDDRQWALTRIEAIAHTQHWTITHDAPAVNALVNVLCVVKDLYPNTLVDRVDDYATLANALAQVDSAAAHDSISTVLGDALLMALRRLAQNSRR